MKNILIFGDSITYGIADTKGGWANRLKQYLNSDPVAIEKEIYRVFVQGISGDTSGGLLYRIESETLPRLVEEYENIFIIAVGINDTQYIQRLERNLIPEDIFAENIRNIINFIKRVSKINIFLELLPIDEKILNPMPWGIEEISFKDKTIERYNAILEKVTKENDVHLLKLYDRFKENHFEKNLIDGIHPNDKGHEMVFNEVLKFLTKNNWIK